MSNFFHSGDLGDAIYALPSVRALGGGRLFFGSRPWTRTRWEDGRLLGLLRPLIDAGGYCEAFLHKGQEIDYDFSTFRNGGYRLGDTIVERQRRWVGAEKAGTSTQPWLGAEPCLVSPIIINRASRWHGFDFPWKALIEEYFDLITFIGLPQEHEEFCKAFGFVYFHACENLLDAAEAIAGAEVFVGNQSCCNAIANALGKKTVCEVCPYAPDCFLNRDNTFFSFNGEIEVEADRRKLSVPSRDGRFGTIVGGRELRHDDAEKLRVIARAAHAFDGTFALHEEVMLT